jgi:plasmid stabilization system protein ParE
MACKISWTPNAIEDYKHVIEYLLTEWSSSVAVHFENITNKKLITLSHHPYLGIASQKLAGIRSILLTKHNRLYYRITDNSIQVLNIFDTRQDPGKNRF